MKLSVSNTLQNVGAFGVGLFAGCAVNIALITLNSKVLYPPPTGLDLEKSADLATYIASLPIPAFGTVFAAHWGQTVVAGLIATQLAVKPTSPMLWTQTMSCLTMMGSIASIQMLSAPLWTWIEIPFHPLLAWMIAKQFD